MELKQLVTDLDKFVKEWIENIQELKLFSAYIQPDYYEDPTGIPELAKDFPLYEDGIEWLEINIINECDERLIMSFYLDNKEGVQISFYNFRENFSLYFKGDVTIYKSIFKFMYRFPETIRHYHRQYRLMQLKEIGLI